MKEFLEKIAYLAGLYQEIKENNLWDYQDNSKVNEWSHLSKEIQPDALLILKIMIKTGILSTIIFDGEHRYVSTSPSRVYPDGSFIVLNSNPADLRGHSMVNPKMFEEKNIESKK